MRNTLRYVAYHTARRRLLETERSNKVQADWNLAAGLIDEALVFACVAITARRTRLGLRREHMPYIYDRIADKACVCAAMFGLPYRAAVYATTRTVLL